MRLSKRAVLLAATSIGMVSLLAASFAFVNGRAARAAAVPPFDTYCETHSANCTEPAHVEQVGNQYYIGHDEPSALFYSNRAGSGNSNVYQLTLPKDPKAQPSQNGTGTTWNFQLHPAFWFGMAMCDDQSAPNPAGAATGSRAGPTVLCTPDSNANIYTDTLGGAHYIGQHPGAAFMELQFYPPGFAPWPAGSSCDATKWCAALNIDSLSRNSNFPVGNPNRNNNPTCLAQTGLEYVNFAFVTKNGVSQAPANPKDLIADPNAVGFTPDPAKDLFMNSGDTLRVALHDTPDGFQTVIDDLTTGKHGFMTASVANGFGQIKFAPAPSTECTVIHQAFHPMYSTSSENTRVPWAAHSYNVAFSDEIGHFEYCGATDGVPGGNCVAAGASDPDGLDADDNGCFNASQSTLVPINGCLGFNPVDSDFDGPEYSNNWPGTIANHGQDKKLHATPILFTSPLTHGHNFDRVAFETDLAAIEPSCNVLTGAGCTNPPVGPNGPTFYPFFSTISGGDQQGDFNGGSCVWGEGGPFLPGATNTFGGSSTTAFGSLLFINYVSSVTPTGVVSAAENYRNIISSNPCQAHGLGGGD
jgi:hypothetical protein